MMDLYGKLGSISGHLTTKTYTGLKAAIVTQTLAETTWDFCLCTAIFAKMKRPMRKSDTQKRERERE